ncbi:MAG: hypothetical protein Q7J15_08870 [Candidatus Desulfaltia sp.]|nr:hypothetical protein [Candidatus Desulfaltia sp.]
MSDETFLKTIPIETGFWKDSVLFCKRHPHPATAVPGKQPNRVRARSVLAYWAIRDLGLTATEVGKHLGLSKSAVSRAANRGQKLIVDQFLSLKE